MTDITTLAYLAGMIDADGFISAHRHKRDGQTYNAPLMGISGVSAEPHFLARSIWGGSVFCYAPKNPKHREQFQWQAVGIRAAVAIREIRPFLLVKRAQADLALEMWGMICRGMPRTDAKLFDLGVRISTMNTRKMPKQVIGR